MQTTFCGMMAFLFLGLAIHHRRRSFGVVLLASIVAGLWAGAAYASSYRDFVIGPDLDRQERSLDSMNRHIETGVALPASFPPAEVD